MAVCVFFLLFYPELLSLLRKNKQQNNYLFLLNFSLKAKFHKGPFRNTLFPPYPIFKNLFELGVSLHNKEGGRFKGYWVQLRKGLVRDYNSKTQCQKIKLSFLFQMGMFLILSWSFIISFSILFGIKNKQFLMGIIIVESLGLLLYSSLVYFLEKFRREYQKYFISLYTFVLRYKNEEQFSQCLKESQIMEISFPPLVEEQKNQFVSWEQNEGEFLGEELDILIETLWFLYEEKNTQNLKILEIGKTIVLVVFFLGAHMSFFLNHFQYLAAS